MLCVCWVGHQKRRAATLSSSRHAADVIDDCDAVYLQRAQQLRRSLTPLPRLSQFRVVAIVTLSNGELLVGANEEASPSLSGAICAERAALGQYRTQYGANKRRPTVCTIYIVSDSNQALAPGNLCREYMYGHEATDATTRVVMQAATSDEEDNQKKCLPRTKAIATTTTLGELYPYPSIYSGLTVNEQWNLGQSLSQLIPSLLVSAETDLVVLPPDAVLMSSSLSGGTDENSSSFQHTLTTTTLLHRLVDSALAAAATDNRDDVFDIRYGAAAAVLVLDTTTTKNGNHSKKKIIQFISSSQVKSLEYGASQDALCQLWALCAKSFCLDDILALVQVDQFGIPHSPFAPARSVWVENGGGHIPVFLLDQGHCDDGLLLLLLDDTDTPPKSSSPTMNNTRLLAVSMTALSPFVPQFRS
jgi:cytidine deaminase